MIIEVADISIDPDECVLFEQAVNQGVDEAISKSKGFVRYRLQRSVESPARYLLLIEWETLEDHTVGFRGSAAHAQWRGIIGRFFAKPPFVEHFQLCSDR